MRHALLLSAILAAGLTIGAPKPRPVQPSQIMRALCSAFDRDSAPWILFGCMFYPPERDPRV